MKNGLNISGTSELVHEITTQEEEALLCYKVITLENGHDETKVDVKTLHAGTIRIARDFSFPCAWNSPREEQFVNPLEYMLTSLGGCATFTWVQGCCVKGIVIFNLSLEISGDYLVDVKEKNSQKIQNIKYKVNIKSNGNRDQIIDIAKKVSCFSPSHRTFLETNSANLELNIFRKDGTSIKKSYQGINPKNPSFASDNQIITSDVSKETTFFSTITWVYGAQSSIQISPQKQSDIDQCVRFGLDQPKQLNGIDSAPNPQEYMLGSLGSEITLNCHQLFENHKIQIKSIEVKTEGNVDLRGFFNTGQNKPVKVHDFFFQVNIQTEGDEKIAEELVCRAISSSLGHNIICFPQPIEVEVFHYGEPIFQFTSTEKMTLEIIAKLKTNEGFKDKN